MNTTIIAEIGVNHNGKVSLAKKLILGAKKIGVKIVKFQFYKTEKLVLLDTPLASYQSLSYSNNKSINQFKMLKKFEFSLEQHIELSNFCKKNKIEYCCSFFHEDDVVNAKKLKLKRIKIPSGEINNFFLLRKVAKLNKEVILSTGMSTDKEVKTAILFLTKNGLKKRKLTILHCSSSYPSQRKDLNLNSISYLNKKYKINVGFSDHSKEIYIPLLAISKGATLIEKHLTLSNNFNGPDHKASLNLKDFKKMLDLIYQGKESFGTSKKVVNKSEKKNIFFARKSLIAKSNIKKGEIFSYSNLTGIRPLKGISLSKIHNYLGKKAKKNFKKNELI